MDLEKKQRRLSEERIYSSVIKSFLIVRSYHYTPDMKRPHQQLTHGLGSKKDLNIVKMLDLGILC